MSIFKPFILAIRFKFLNLILVWFVLKKPIKLNLIHKPFILAILDMF